MKPVFKIGIAVAAWGTIGLIAIPPIVTSCSSEKNRIEDRVIDEGLLRNDDLIAVRTSVGKVTIKKKVIKKLKKGKKYTVKITYLKKTISKKVTVKK